MAQCAREIFEQFRTLRYELSLRNIRGTYLFEIEQVGNWFVSVDQGAISLDDKWREAECIFSLSEQDFVDIVEGRRNLLTSELQGRVQVRGDVGLAQAFHHFVSTFPVEFPTACSPQAWSAGAPLLFIRTFLGLEPIASRLLADPAVPKQIGWLELQGIPGRWGRSDAFGRGTLDIA